MPYQEYRLDYMHLVILALLRLAKYDFTQSSDATLDVDEDSDLSHDDEIVESINQATGSNEARQINFPKKTCWKMFDYQFVNESFKLYKTLDSEFKESRCVVKKLVFTY